MSVENDAARAAKSGAIAGQVRVLRPGVFCPGKGRGRGASGWVCWAGFHDQSANCTSVGEDRPWWEKIDRTLAIGG